MRVVQCRVECNVGYPPANTHECDTCEDGKRSDSTSTAGRRSLLSTLVSSGSAMQSLIDRKNLENYCKQFAETKGEAELRQLRRPLDEEKAKKSPAPRREDS